MEIIDTQPITGWGIDRQPEKRPGVPREIDGRIAKDTIQGQSPWTDTIPLKGLSGVIRRAAYKIPSHQPHRWMMLMLADRIDVMEGFFGQPKVRRLTLGAVVAGGVSGALYLLRKLR